MADNFKTESNESLQRMIVDMRESLRVARFEGAGSRSRNVRGIRETRRQIARVLTELHSRALSADGTKIASETKTA